MTEPLLTTAKRVCSDEQYAALELAHRGMSQRAIAEALDISRSSVKSRLDNAYRRIRLASKENAA